MYSHHEALNATFIENKSMEGWVNKCADRLVQVHVLLIKLWDDTEEYISSLSEEKSELIVRLVHFHAAKYLSA